MRSLKRKQQAREVHRSLGKKHIERSRKKFEKDAPRPVDGHTDNEKLNVISISMS